MKTQEQRNTQQINFFLSIDVGSNHQRFYKGTCNCMFKASLPRLVKYCPMCGTQITFTVPVYDSEEFGWVTIEGGEYAMPFDEYLKANFSKEQDSIMRMVQMLNLNEDQKRDIYYEHKF